MSRPTTPAERALGHVVSGIYILTAGRDDRATGMLASWVQQCSFEPPQLAVAVQQDRPIGGLLHDGAAFTVNILGEDHKDLMKHFAKGFPPGTPAFEGLRVERSPEGAPILSDALGHVECRVRGRFPAGDHDLVVGEVVGGDMTSDGRPMVHVRRSGTHY